MGLKWDISTSFMEVLPWVFNGKIMGIYGDTRPGKHTKSY